MKLKKRELFEIIDSNGDLIGKDDFPKNGSDLETQAHGTTDQNVQMGNQPFRYDMLGRFGFTLLPFFEGKEENQDQIELLTDLSKELFDLYKIILEYYYRNPNKIKSEFRQISQSEKNDEKIVNDYIRDNMGKYAKKIIKVVEKHFENAFKTSENIDESAVIEDKVINKKSEDEISKKGEDKDVRKKSVEKIAGLINKKFEKDDIDKLINLLEKK
jgi:hypothetical protein